MKKLVFRFDIDTHKCIRDGVPQLLDVSEMYNVPFSFFLNTGKAISFYDSIKTLLCAEQQENEEVVLMSALQKLGMRDYLIAALINPNLISYKKQVLRLLSSKCEVGIHGGKNHAKWQYHAKTWSEDRIRKEITFAVDKIRKIYPEYQLGGFASPAWNSPNDMLRILKEQGFTYCADLHGKYINPVKEGNTERISVIGVNLLGEPGGVAFWENCRARGMSDEEICNQVCSTIEKNEITVVYDHPYYAGVKEIKCIEKIIDEVQKLNCSIVTVESLI